MMDDDNVCCKNCCYFHAYNYLYDDSNIESDYGECRRFPPKPVPAELNGFPIVGNDCWCGEFDT